MKVRDVLLVVTLASLAGGCKAEAPAAVPAHVRAIEVTRSTAAEWQAASAESRTAGARDYARIAFPNARPDQLDELADRFVICIDRDVLRAEPGADVGVIAFRCEAIVA